MSTFPATSFGSDSDGDLRRRVANYLASRHVLSLRFLTIEASNGVITLRGRVRSFHERQVGVSSAQRVAGVLRVLDAIEVAPRPAHVRSLSPPRASEREGSEGGDSTFGGAKGETLHLAEYGRRQAQIDG